MADTKVIQKEKDASVSTNIVGIVAIIPMSSMYTTLIINLFYSFY